MYTLEASTLQHICSAHGTANHSTTTGMDTLLQLMGYHIEEHTYVCRTPLCNFLTRGAFVHMIGWVVFCLLSVTYMHSTYSVESMCNALCTAMHHSSKQCSCNDRWSPHHLEPCLHYISSLMISTPTMIQHCADVKVCTVFFTGCTMHYVVHCLLHTWTN